ncbi:MAG: DUF2959 domain-containing protein [Phycisphaerales bacterium]|nr:DUF2959 domain-containing protein [Phycisphaerales bacterium]
MKNSTSVFVAVLQQVALLLFLVSIAGCGSKNKSFEEGMKTGSNLQELARKIETGEKQIDTSMREGDALVNAPQGDPRKQFEQYRKSLRSLESTASDVRDMANDMQKRSEAYFAQWEKDMAAIKSEDIKNVSAQRRAERVDQFNKLQASYGQVRDAFKPFLTDLQSIEQALSVELTAGNLEAMKPFVAKARNDAVPLNKALDDLRLQFQQLGVQMSPVTKK